ncbi:MAG: hypothetical protein QG553_752 [Patescibacteria group bacterium]|nr:hypothetical protein [Patescibacteria group bacterium]
MNFYEVLVSSPSFHGKEALTYHCDDSLARGSVVALTLRGKPLVGVVLKKVSQPTFTTKPIDKLILPQAIPAPTLQLVDWLRSYYPAPLGIYAQLLLPSSLVRKRDITAGTLAPASPAQPLPPLTSEQTHAFATLKDKPAALLHGDTGSGKTRLYLELARQQLNKGRSVLLLTPEIGLTPQLEERVRQAVDCPVVVIHSGLTPAERRTAWLQILQASGPLVVIGPRSALFTPIRNLGLIVVDEAHDHAYKQDSLPYYQALRVGSRLAQLHQGQLVLGTATPAVSEYALAQAKQIPIVRLTDKPAGSETEKKIELIDLKDRTQFTKHPHLSNTLLTAIQKSLDRGEQSLVMLNRRGTARLVLCQTCGWQATCPNCDLPLTFHADKHRLRCHTCGHTQSVPSSCPACSGTELIFKGVGTKSLTEELKKVFPGARVQRFDTDNLKAERLDQHYQAVLDGQVDILVGTQMLAKGLDLPGLTVVGVVVADSGLYFPDYTAEEQTYQLLTQVIGRVGRGHKAGTVVIQSYSPKGTAIQAAITQDWTTFYEQQTKERKTYGFPPFYHCLKLSCGRATPKSAQTAAEKLADNLLRAGLRIEVVGPTPSFYEKIGGKYHWQLVVKAKDRGELLKVIPLLPTNWTHDLDPLNLL